MSNEQQTTPWTRRRGVRMALGAAAAFCGFVGLLAVDGTEGLGAMMIFAGGALFGQAHG